MGIDNRQEQLYIRRMKKATGEKALVYPRIEEAFNLLGKKWMGLIIHVLADGPKYFCELEKAIRTLSARILADRIKELESEGIVERTVHTGTPVRVVYSLTEKGKALQPIMRGIVRWA